MAIVSEEQVIKVLRQYNPWWRMLVARGFKRKAENFCCGCSY